MNCSLQALLDPACYPHPVAGPVEMIETHISWVFLAGDFAYKIKKAVVLPFLDFSSLDLRRHYCLEELRLNRRTAPELYLEVMPVGGTATQPRIGEAKDVFEYAVRMRRFSQDALAERVAGRGELDAAQIDVLVATITAFHAAIPQASASSCYGDNHCVTTPARENVAQIRGLELHALAGDDVERLRAWTEAASARLAPIFDERKRGGYVRECHGDLHLGNIVYFDGRPLLFDCLEFQPEWRWIDVVNDAAFLGMDLHDRLGTAAGQRFLNAYLEAAGDYAGLRVLGYYLVYRALVRAKVILIRAGQAESKAGNPDSASRTEAGRYLQLAKALTQSGPPALIIMHGLAGSGKSSVAQALLERSAAIRVRSDVERKRLHGFEAAARTHASPNGGIYAPSASRVTYDRLKCIVRDIVAAGRPAIVDATFLRRGLRDEFRQLATALSVPFILVSCRATTAELQRRVATRQAEKRDASEAGLHVLANQIATDEPLTAAELEDATLVDTQTDKARLLALVEGIVSRISGGAAPPAQA